MKKYQFTPLVISLHFFVSALFSQNIDPQIETFRAAIAHCFVQDAFGFIWIGTQDGLLRYDGISFKQYHYIPFDSTSLSSNNIYEIKEDKYHNLWISTHGNGLNYFDQRTGRFTRFARNSDQNHVLYVFGMAVNEDNSLWLASPSHGLSLFRIDPAGRPEYHHYNLLDDQATSPALNKNSAISLFKDRNEIIWVGTISEGLLKFDPRTGSVIQYKHDPNDPFSISHNTVSCICEDDSGNLWIGTGFPAFSRSGGGLNMYNRKTGKFRSFRYDGSDETSLSSNGISSLLIDYYGVLWIGTWTSHLNSVSISDLMTKEKPDFRHHTNFGNGRIYTLFEDRQNNIWIGEHKLQMYKFHRQLNRFDLLSRTAEYPNSLSSDGFMCVFSDHLGRIWAGSEGVDMFVPQSGQYRHFHYTPGDTNGICSNQVICIQEDREGKIWILTRHGGIDVLNPATGKISHLGHRAQEPPASVLKDILYMLPSAKGGMWMASPDKQIQRFDLKTTNIHTFTIKQGSKGDFLVSKLFEDRSGKLWVGTSNDGIYTLDIDNQDEPEIVHYHHDPLDPNSLSSDFISDFIHPVVTDTSAIWIATSSGLNRLDLQTGLSSHIYRKDGLATNWIAILLEDVAGNLWCCTPYGLCFYDTNTGRIINYDQADGLPENFGCNAFQQSGAKGPDGRLYFAGGGGILTFQPREIKSNPNKPAIRFTDFKIFGKSVALDTTLLFKSGITLDYTQNMFSLDFAALDFNDPRKNLYKYKLEGFEDRWIDIRDAHSATFTNLDPGEYMLRVCGSNNHGLWNDTGAAIRINILPPWWRTGWAYLGYIMVTLSLLAGSVHLGTRQRQRKFEQVLVREKEKEQIRSRIARDLHDEIGSNLGSIAILSQMLEDKYKMPLEMKKRLHEIPNIARATAEAMRDIIWFINPDNDDLDKLIAKMRTTANMMLESLAFKFKVNETSNQPDTDLNFRRNLFLLYKECLQNIIKHAQAKNVSICISLDDNSLQLKITDNGVGFDPEGIYSGSGLKNLRQRAEMLRGNLMIESDPGMGTRITLSINIP